MKVGHGLCVGVLAACAVTGDRMDPIWAGPAVSGRNTADGGLELELLAPTAGHAFELVGVRSDGGRAVVDCVHRTPPPGTLVAQVLTPLCFQIGPERLGASREVVVRVLPPGADAVPHRALVLARP
ncbi:MAG: hypothetical protein JNK15_22135 [Planctomycetes bacterium]|nr:hypothetical protein [Planctomycetota bacterium]